MRYLLGGYNGMRNVGDDVLLYVTLAEVARLDPAATFTPGASVQITPGGRRFHNLRHLLRHDVWLFGVADCCRTRAPRAGAATPRSLLGHQDIEEGAAPRRAQLEGRGTPSRRTRWPVRARLYAGGAVLPCRGTRRRRR
jgi:hypothetical protein